MSRSFKKRNIGWLCCVNHGDMKKWKKECNRVIRRTPLDKEIGDGGAFKKINNPWDSPADGKRHFDDPKFLRK